MTASDADTKGRIGRTARWDVVQHDRETAWRRNLWVAPFPKELRKRKAVDLRCISRSDVAVGRCDFTSPVGRAMIVGECIGHYAPIDTGCFGFFARYDLLCGFSARGARAQRLKRNDIRLYRS
jgi:hypothetical protein